MKIRDVMTKDVHLARPGDTLQEVAARMAKGDFGFVPVADGDQLIGAITDRDIVVRALAAGAAPSAPVVEYITRDPQTVLDRRPEIRAGSDGVAPDSPRPGGGQAWPHRRGHLAGRPVDPGEGEIRRRDAGEHLALTLPPHHALTGACHSAP